MAIADMYDALTSRRVYKEPVQHEQAVEIMTECAAGSFDPRIFSAFLRVADEFKKVSLKLTESNPKATTRNTDSEPLLSLPLLPISGCNRFKNTGLHFASGSGLFWET
jgi:HD-GYP domain-containing protein (c-di-GMP phosphodiesterase class II)